MNGKIVKFDNGKERLKIKAEKFLEAGDYISALQYTVRRAELYGEDYDSLLDMADAYENIGLFSSAINCYFLALDGCDEEDLPDVYEGLAVNFLNLGKDSQSAYYYACLVNTDDTLTKENKEEIADLFTEKKNKGFRFVYPPKKADFSKELSMGASALKSGNATGAIKVLSTVDEDSGDYPAAREMQAVANLLSGNCAEAEKICLELVEKDPNNVQAYATLSAVYSEQCKTEESVQIAKRLYSLSADASYEEKYKIAMVCCENELNREAYTLLTDVSKESPYDGNLLYFRAVAAAKSGLEKLALELFGRICAIYPDAGVAKYYHDELQAYFDGEREVRPEFTYFYRVPQAEKERRSAEFEYVLSLPQPEATIQTLFLDKRGLLKWCFDEMDGMDTELQFVALMLAIKGGINSFLREILLDCEVSETFKYEALRQIALINEDSVHGVVIDGIYRKIRFYKAKFGRKKHKVFAEGYARIQAQFAPYGETVTAKLKESAETLYESLKMYDGFDAAKDSETVACAIYLGAGLNYLGKKAKDCASLFGTSQRAVEKLMKVAFEPNKGTDNEE